MGYCKVNPFLKIINSESPRAFFIPYEGVDKQFTLSNNSIFKYFSCSWYFIIYNGGFGRHQDLPNKPRSGDAQPS